VIDPSPVGKFLADDPEIDSIKSMAERQTRFLIVMDGKRETAAITVAGRRRPWRGERVKIINPFGILRTPEEPGAGCNPLLDLDRHGALARKRREVSGRRRKGRGGAPNEDGDG
jgi:hypothetical protein